MIINTFPWNNHEKTVKWRRLPRGVVQLRHSPSKLFCGVRTVCVCIFLLLGTDSFVTFWDRCYFMKKVWWQNFERGSWKVGWGGSPGTACWHCMLSFPPCWRISYKSKLYFSLFCTLSVTEHYTRSASVFTIFCGKASVLQPYQRKVSKHLNIKFQNT